MKTPAVVKRYNLALPSEQDLLLSLDRLMKHDQSRQLWSAACRASGVSPPLTMDQFERALMQLKDGKGMASIAAVSMLVRLKSYRTLSAMNDKQG
ncbi:hypothetical protein ACFFTM_25165 [Pseudoduganella plicata]|uniref:Uncharacterized protein n=1 Tax=Pseudoduganella plicata TaxID=321984 RepID=A0AA87Y7I9_9BURK|nr:hypothetical protein [Pseudoduganella plicata]GGY90884.1 hypothetical protein GCM10007388_25180 [Pseudoduganella plicata]